MAAQYAVVAFPTLASASVVERLRRRFDPLASVLSAHVTLVFPFADAMVAPVLAQHVTEAVAGVSAFDITLDPPTIADGGYLFLNVAVGAEQFVALHDRLYSGALARYRSSTLEYRPHVTIGRLASAALLTAAAHEASRILMEPLRGRVDHVAVFRLDEPLQGAVEFTVALRDAIEIEAEPITSADAAFLIRALNVELAAAYSEPGANHFRLDAEEVAPGNGVFLVVRSVGRPVGCGALRQLRDTALVEELGPRVGELKRMYIAPEVRGRGVGRSLLMRLEAEARALGLARLVLETGTRQAAAIALYRRAGFADIPAYGAYAASVATSVCLAKDL